MTTWRVQTCLGDSPRDTSVLDEGILADALREPLRAAPPVPFGHCPGDCPPDMALRDRRAA